MRGRAKLRLRRTELRLRAVVLRPVLCAEEVLPLLPPKGPHGCEALLRSFVLRSELRLRALVRLCG